MNFRNSTFIHVRERHDLFSIHAVSIRRAFATSHYSAGSELSLSEHSGLLTEWIEKSGLRGEGDFCAPTVYVFFDGDSSMDVEQFSGCFRAIKLAPFIIGPIRQAGLVAGLLQKDIMIATKKTVLRELNEAQLVCQLMIAFHECVETLDAVLPRLQEIVDLWHEVHKV